MSKNERGDALHEATIGRWARKKEKMEDDFESGKTNLTRYLKAALGKVGTESRQNIARDILDARRNRKNVLDQNQSNWSNRDDEVITGMEDFPWDRSVED